MTTSQYPGTPAHQPGTGHGQAGYAPPAFAPYAPAPYGHGYAGQPVPVGPYLPPSGPVGRVRSTGVAILLTIVTLGIYSLVWYYSVHEEMKKHTGNGLGGGLALVIALFVGIASPYLVSSEVGSMYERAGRAKPVSGATGLWYFPGVFLLVGPVIWFVQTNGALNAYWRSLGAR